MTRSASRTVALSALLTLTACPHYERRPHTTVVNDCVPGATGPRAFDALSYDLSARYDWAARKLVATEDVTLALCPGGSAQITLDAAAPITVASVLSGGRAIPYERAGDALQVDLTPLAPGTAPVKLTIGYEAAASTAMAGLTSAWQDDPVLSRVVLTDSEPDRARLWLVSKDDPSDRALFSVEVSVPAGEDVVSNGERLSDQTAGGVRRVRYALDVPLPTYLMAFAAGELDHAERTLPARPGAGGRPALPIALWWRRGLAVEPEVNLDAIEEAMAVFEGRLGPYPFARYAVVLVPNGGGMENATITFDYEWSGQGPGSYGLNAHELAHHWFGDWVTMRRYEDVWVKEGMATLLAAEAERGFRDEAGLGRLFGRDFSFDPSDAIVDPTLTGLDRYTSGPYERAASLITQVRAKVGEEAFWRHCREFLAAHAKASATGEDFVRAFAPDLDEGTIQRVLALLPEKGVPTFAVDSTPGAGGAQDLTYELDDPTGAVLVPPAVTVVSPAGEGADHPVTPGVPLALSVPAGGYAAADEGEIHWEAPVATPSFPDALHTPAATALLSRSAAHQEEIAIAWPYALTSADLGGLLAGMDSAWARANVLAAACGAWPGQVPAAAFDPPPERWPLSGRLAYRPYLACGSSVGSAFEAELLERAGRMAVTDLARLEYLLSFHYGPDGRAAIQNLAAQAPSRRLRYWADQRRTVWDTTGLLAGTPAPEARLDVRAEEAKAGKPREGKQGALPR